MRNILDESLFEEIEVSDDTLRYGISELLMDAIKQEFDIIQFYNTVIVNGEQYPEIIDLIKDIVKVENENVGKLQASLKTVSADAIAIDDGEKDAEEHFDVDTPVDESLVESWITEAHEGLWTPEQMKDVLARRDDQVGKALVKLWERQTEDEQATHTTSYRNNVGFNGLDADILSSFAEQFQKKGYLSKKQLEIARRKIMKYAKQLANIANENIKVEKPAPTDIVPPIEGGDTKVDEPAPTDTVPPIENESVVSEAVEEPDKKEKEEITKDTSGVVMKAIRGNASSKSDTYETAALAGDYVGEIEYKDHIIKSNNKGKTWVVMTPGGEVKKSAFDSFISAKAYVNSIVKG